MGAKLTRPRRTLNAAESFRAIATAHRFVDDPDPEVAQAARDVTEQYVQSGPISLGFGQAWHVLATHLVARRPRWLGDAYEA